MSTLTLNPPPQPPYTDHSNDRRAFFEKLPVVCLLDLDQACHICNQNLRTQPVRRDPRTRILVCRCPQCGEFHPVPESITADVSSDWMKYLARSLMLLWLIIVGGLGLGLAMYQCASHLLFLELVTTHQTMSSNLAHLSGIEEFVTRYVPKRHLLEYKYLAFAAVTFTIAIVGVAFTAIPVVFYHWRRWSIAAFCFIEPAITAGLACVIWRMNAPELFHWGACVIGLLAGTQVIAALAGVILGRPLVRILIHLAVPPHLRDVLRHLWNQRTEVAEAQIATTP